MCEWIAEQYGIVKRQNLLRTTKDSKFWRSMITQELKVHDTWKRMPSTTSCHFHISGRVNCIMVLIFFTHDDQMLCIWKGWSFNVKLYTVHKTNPGYVIRNIYQISINYFISAMLDVFIRLLIFFAKYMIRPFIRRDVHHFLNLICF